MAGARSPPIPVAPGLSSRACWAPTRLRVCVWLVVPTCVARPTLTKGNLDLASSGPLGHLADPASASPPAKTSLHRRIFQHLPQRFKPLIGRHRGSSGPTHRPGSALKQSGSAPFFCAPALQCVCVWKCRELCSDTQTHAPQRTTSVSSCSKSVKPHFSISGIPSSQQAANPGSSSEMIVGGSAHKHGHSPMLASQSYVALGQLFSMGIYSRISSLSAWQVVGNVKRERKKRMVTTTSQWERQVILL